MAYAISLWSQPALPIAGSDNTFPVRRFFCVGRNYVEHQKEMGGDGREQPFFFLKAAHTLVPRGGDVHYPLKTSNYHYETEMVVAISKGGRRIEAKKANEHIFGYAVGIDMTRRDVQAAAKKGGRPWDMAKGFDHSAPISPIVPAMNLGEHPKTARIALSVNGAVRQDADIADMIWDLPHVISHLSKWVQLKRGDLIFTGTPAGVGAVVRGDVLEGEIAGIGTVRTTIV